MKYVILSLSVLAMLAMYAPAYADGGPCQGTILSSSDLDGNNKRPWNFSCCQTGYRLHGLVCSDIAGKDDGDGCSAVCRSIKTGDIALAHSDHQGQRGTYQCDKTEVMVGIECRDSSKHGGGVNSDVADTCTPICENPKTGNLRTVPNHDMQSTGSRGTPNRVVRRLNSGERATGIACKDIANGTSDRLDGCTIVTAPFKYK